MSELSALRERVAAATGADEKLDAEILCAMFAPPDARVEQSPINFAWCIYHGQDTHGRPRLWERRGLSYRPQGWPVTASLDAALALVEAKKPEHALGIICAAIAKFAATDAFIEGEPASKHLLRFMIAALLAALDGDTPNG